MIDPLSARLEKEIQHRLVNADSGIWARGGASQKETIALIVSGILPILRDEVAAAEIAAHLEMCVNPEECRRSSGGALARALAAERERTLAEVAELQYPHPYIKNEQGEPIICKFSPMDKNGILALKSPQSQPEVRK